MRLDFSLAGIEQISEKCYPWRAVFSSKEIVRDYYQLRSTNVLMDKFSQNDLLCKFVKRDTDINLKIQGITKTFKVCGNHA